MSDRKISMEVRTFTAMDSYIQDEDFDFDAGLQVTGDFVDDEKSQYAQMIADVLNKHVELNQENEKLKADVARMRNLMDAWLKERDAKMRAEELINSHGMNEAQRTERLNELRSSASQPITTENDIDQATRLIGLRVTDNDDRN